MHRTVRALVATACLGLPAQASAQTPAQDKPPWGALTDVVAAGEIVLRDVCLPGIVEHKNIEQLALYERLVAMSSKAANAGASDKVWRLASINPVYAVAWADGSCSTYVDRGPTAKLRAMAQAVILARPEGFVLRSSGLADGDRVERSVYCGGTGEDRFVATITTPNGRTARGTRALSSTIYDARRSQLCAPSATP